MTEYVKEGEKIIIVIFNDEIVKFLQGRNRIKYGTSSTEDARARLSLSDIADYCGVKLGLYDTRNVVVYLAGPPSAWNFPQGIVPICFQDGGKLSVAREAYAWLRDQLVQFLTHNTYTPNITVMLITARWDMSACIRNCWDLQPRGRLFLVSDSESWSSTLQMSVAERKQDVKLVGMGDLPASCIHIETRTTWEHVLQEKEACIAVEPRAAPLRADGSKDPSAPVEDVPWPTSKQQTVLNECRIQWMAAYLPTTPRVLCIVLLRKKDRERFSRITEIVDVLYPNHDVHRLTARLSHYDLPVFRGVEYVPGNAEGFMPTELEISPKPATGPAWPTAAPAAAAAFTASQDNSDASSDESGPSRSLRCDYMFVCKHGLSCRFTHTQQELDFFSVNNGVGKLQYKSAICVSDVCAHADAPHKCYRAHGEHDLFCSLCKQRGHAYSRCPKHTLKAARRGQGGVMKWDSPKMESVDSPKGFAQRPGPSPVQPELSYFGGQTGAWSPSAEPKAAWGFPAYPRMMPGMPGMPGMEHSEVV